MAARKRTGSFIETDRSRITRLFPDIAAPPAALMKNYQLLLSSHTRPFVGELIVVPDSLYHLAERCRVSYISWRFAKPCT